MKCPECDTVNPDESKYCKECATSLTGGEDAQPIFTRTLESPAYVVAQGTVFSGRYEIIEEPGRGGIGKA